MKLTIIPDVLGRPFWRDAVKDVADTPVIFLGDYLDPYPQDMVTWEDALQGLHDIIELKKSIRSRCLCSWATTMCIISKAILSSRAAEGCATNTSRKSGKSSWRISTCST